MHLSYARDTVNTVVDKTMQDLHQSTIEKITYLKSTGLSAVEECEIKRELEQNNYMKDHFDNHDMVDPLEPRRAFYGVRTNAANLFHQCVDGRKIRYDVLVLSFSSSLVLPTSVSSTPPCSKSLSLLVPSLPTYSFFPLL